MLCDVLTPSLSPLIAEVSTLLLAVQESFKQLVLQPLLPTLKLYLFIFQNLYQKGNEVTISFLAFLEFLN
jgi:hypothetical protein